MSEHNHQSSSSGSFLNGMVVGGIVGAAAVFLLGTNKGKKVLKVLTEQGMEGIGQLQDLMEEASEEIEDTTEEPIAPVDLKKTQGEKSGTAHAFSKTRRFFKRLTK